MRRRYRWNPETRAMEEVGAEWTDAPRSTGDLGKFEYDGLRATDGTDISSRTKRRDYMRAHGVADPRDFTETTRKAAEARARPDTRAVAEQVGRIAYEMSRTPRRKR